MVIKKIAIAICFEPKVEEHLIICEEHSSRTDNLTTDKTETLATCYLLATLAIKIITNSNRVVSHMFSVDG